MTEPILKRQKTEMGIIPIRLLPEDDPRESDDTICFGMLVFDVKQISTVPGVYGNLRRSDDGTLSPMTSPVALASLQKRENELLELFCTENVGVELRLELKDHPKRSGTSQQATAILYGNPNLASDIKETLGRLELYLQDPIHATKDLLYSNPQKLYNYPGARTSLLGASQYQLVTKSRLTPVDILSEFVSSDSIDETESSQDLLTPLQTHQKQALTFMVRREQGWNLSKGKMDVWSIQHDVNHNMKYLNNIDKSLHDQPPPVFRGGIIADTMGSGKSLSMISLIAHDKHFQSTDTGHCQSGKTRTTLVVAPAIVLNHWKAEFSKHIRIGSISWRCHHGSTKILDPADLENLDIVLTTYQTLGAEWRAKKISSLLFTHHWHRVILDEAHWIKTVSAVTTQAAYAISATCRWVVTGTPIRNRLSELHSLLLFIRIYPYSNKDVFDQHIIHMWQDGKETEAIHRLKSLLNFIMLRRSVHHIILPKRQDLRYQLDFTFEERSSYKAAKDIAFQCIEDFLQSSPVQVGYRNALKKIETLRQICNFGMLPKTNKSDDEKLKCIAEAPWSEDTAALAFRQFPSLGLSTACRGCGSMLDYGSTSSDRPVQAFLFKCLYLLCAQCCAPILSQTEHHSPCLCKEICPVSRVHLGDSTTATSTGISYDRCNHQFPTKIQALMGDLRKVSTNTQSVVFSFWKATLDLAGMALGYEGITYARIDGDVNFKKRIEIFEDFSKQKYQVLLITLSCGAVGLNLTSASRAYLMEPQWNPAIEEQALARIHRIGQTKTVTTVRFIIKDTIEKYVIDVQDRKKDLVTALLPTQTSSSGVSQERLKELREHLR